MPEQGHDYTGSMCITTWFTSINHITVTELPLPECQQHADPRSPISEAKGDVKDMGDKSKQTGQSAQEKAKGSMGDARSRMQQGMKSGEDMSKHAYEKAGEGV